MIEGLFQPIHLVLILAIIMIVFGAGKLPEMGGAVGRGIKEFRKEVRDATDSDPEPVDQGPVAVTAAPMQASATVFCTSCGERMPGGAKFCPSCGAGVAKPQAETVEAIPVSAEVEPQKAETPSA